MKLWKEIIKVIVRLIPSVTQTKRTTTLLNHKIGLI